MEYFCILSGGGVRGTAYVGVFRALEEIGITIKGLAGSSVGSIFASFYALGYTIDEIEEIFLKAKYENFRDINLALNKNFGLWKGDNILNWIKEIIEKKFYQESYEKEANLPVTFKDIEKDLIIIATDISTGSYKEFSKYATPDESIATAIRASISLPGIFKPTWVDDNCIIDGDIIRGLPFWSFSEHMNPPDCRVMEFRLEGSNPKQQIESTIDYITAIINTSSNISTEFIMNKYSQNDKYDYVKIDTKDTMPVDFSMKNEKKQDLAKTGYDATMEYFRNPLRYKKVRLFLFYQNLNKELSTLRENIKKQKSLEFQQALYKAMLMVIKNQDLMETSFYNKCIDILEEISSNTKIGGFFKKASLNKKDKLISELEKIILIANNKQMETKEHLNIISGLLL